MRQPLTSLAAALLVASGALQFGPPAPSATFDRVPAATRATIARQASGHPVLAVTARSGARGELVYEALIAGTSHDVDVAVDGRGQVVGRFIVARAVGVEGPPLPPPRRPRALATPLR